MKIVTKLFLALIVTLLVLIQPIVRFNDWLLLTVKKYLERCKLHKFVGMQIVKILRILFVLCRLNYIIKSERYIYTIFR